MTNDENLHFNKISGDFCMVYEALFKGVFVKDTIFFIEDIWISKNLFDKKVNSLSLQNNLVICQ